MPEGNQRSARRGRSARMEQRQQAEDDTDQSKWMGVTGGNFKPLSAGDIDQIHEAVLDLLETLGLSQAPQSMIDVVTENGGTITDKERLLFPRAMVERALTGIRRDVILWSRRNGYHLDISGARVHVGTRNTNNDVSI